jgi:hypothetical protein
VGLAPLLGIFFFVWCACQVGDGHSALVAFFHDGFPLLTFQRINSGISDLLPAGDSVHLRRRADAARRYRHPLALRPALVGHVRGGLASVNIFQHAVHGIRLGRGRSALGSILIPVMKEKGYRDAVNVTVTSDRRRGHSAQPQHDHIPRRRWRHPVSKLFLAGWLGSLMLRAWRRRLADRDQAQPSRRLPGHGGAPPPSRPVSSP